jgi:RNA-dependent RNA polymerase
MPSFSNYDNSKIFDNIYNYLNEGIKIAGRNYDFLAYSSSQLRDHSAWFFSPTENLNCDIIRKRMGGK